MCIFLPRLAGETDVLLRCDNIIQLTLYPPPPHPGFPFEGVGGGRGWGNVYCKVYENFWRRMLPFFTLMVVQTKFAVKAS
jgi:hypothetical protein